MSKKLQEKFCEFVSNIHEAPKSWSLRQIAGEMYHHHSRFIAANNAFGQHHATDTEQQAEIAIRLLGDRVPVVEKLDTEILAAVKKFGKDSFDMGSWHVTVPEEESSCGTAHCRAGWATTIAPNGKEFDYAFGPEIAGAIIYKRNTGRVPDFFASNAAAMRDMKASAKREAEED